MSVETSSIVQSISAIFPCLFKAEKLISSVYCAYNSFDWPLGNVIFYNLSFVFISQARAYNASPIKRKKIWCQRTTLAHTSFNRKWFTVLPIQATVAFASLNNNLTISINLPCIPTFSTIQNKKFQEIESNAFWNLVLEKLNLVWTL